MDLAERRGVPRERTRRPPGSAHGIVRAEHVMTIRTRFDRRARRRGPPPRPAPPACPPTTSDRPRSSWWSRKALPSWSISGPSRYLPVSGSCSTRSWRSSVRSSPWTVVFASPRRSAGFAHPQPGVSPRRAPSRSVPRGRPTGSCGSAVAHQRSGGVSAAARSSAPNSSDVEAAPDPDGPTLRGPRYEARPFRASIGVVAAAPASAATPRGVQRRDRAAPSGRRGAPAAPASMHRRSSCLLLRPRPA